MVRSTSENASEKSPDKASKSRSDSENDSDLDEEEFIVEKILKMRTTKKGKVQCESTGKKKAFRWSNVFSSFQIF